MLGPPGAAELSRRLGQAPPEVMRRGHKKEKPRVHSGHGVFLRVSPSSERSPLAALHSRSAHLFFLNDWLNALVPA